MASKRWEPSAAAGIIGLAVFQLVQTWNANAPTLADVRCAPIDKEHPDYLTTATQLKDADYMVGGLAVIMGTTYLVLTKDATAMFIVIGTWGALSLWYHAVLNAIPAGKDA